MDIYYKAIPCTGEGYELPTEDGAYHCICSNKWIATFMWSNQYNRFIGADTPVTHWLKKVEIPELSDEEIKKMANDYCGDEMGQIRSIEAKNWSQLLQNGMEMYRTELKKQLTNK